MNISFVRLGTEECEDCDLQTQHIEVAHRGEKCVRNTNGVYTYPQLCEICIKFNKHQAAANSVRAEYEEEKQRTKTLRPSSKCKKCLILSTFLIYRVESFKWYFFGLMIA